MSLFSRLAEKSWQTHGNEHFSDPVEYRPAASTVGVYVYFGVATVIFALLSAAYLVRMGMEHGMQHGGGGDWQAMPEPPLLWINTAVLAASSVAWEAARRAAKRGARENLRMLTIAGGVLGFVFLAGQLLLWAQYQAAGYFLAANPANSFFYLLTAIHGLHLAGGLVAWARTFGQMGEHADSARLVRNIRLCALYWHFLLLIWALLAALLIST